MKRLPMNPRVLAFTVCPDYMLTITFKNGEVKTFDTRPYLNTSVFFQELLDKSYFSKAFVSGGTIEWPNGQDFCPDTLYELGVPNQTNPVDLQSWETSAQQVIQA